MFNVYWTEIKKKGLHKYYRALLHKNSSCIGKNVEDMKENQFKLTLFTVDSNKQGLTDTPVSSYVVHTGSLYTRGAGTLVDICYKK